MRNIPLYFPLLAAECQQAQADYEDGVAALQAKDYVTAEGDFRSSLTDAPFGQSHLGPGGEAYFGLAEALTGQGRIAEALQTYATLFNPDPHESFGGSYFTRVGLRYALLLNQTGQWAEALKRYQDALPNVPTGGGDNLPMINVAFAPNVPQPTALAAAVNMALGVSDSFTPGAVTEFEDVRAFQEYSQALQLEPNWSLTNFYYGFGWQRLGPADKAKLGSVQQAKAALLKAVRTGKGDVKKAAKKALLVAMKPK